MLADGREAEESEPPEPITVDVSKATLLGAVAGGAGRTAAGGGGRTTVEGYLIVIVIFHKKGYNAAHPLHLHLLFTNRCLVVFHNKQVQKRRH